jgi:hypothetical protein
LIVNPLTGIFFRMAVEAPPRVVSYPLRLDRTSRTVAEDAPNDIETVLAIAASGANDIDLGKLSEEEFLRYFGLDD